MVEILDVNEGIVLKTVQPNTSVLNLIKYLSNNLEVDENLIFLLNESGMILSQNMMLYDYVKGLNTYLLFYRKDKIELGFPVKKINWSQFKTSPIQEWYDSKFDFTGYETSELYNTSITYDNMMFELSEYSRQAYAEFKTSFEYMKSADTAIKIQLKSAKALIESCRSYYEDTNKLWENLKNDVFNSKSRLGDKAAQYKAQYEELIKAQNWNDVLKKINAKKFGEELLSKWNTLEYKISKLKTSFFKKIENNIIEIEDSFMKTEFSALDALNKLEILEIEDQETLFLENFTACTCYNEFREKLYFAFKEYDGTVEDHLKKLESYGSSIESHTNSAASLSGILKRMKSKETILETKIKSVSTFYKKYVQTSVSSVSLLKLVIRNKISKYYQYFDRLVVQEKILSFPSLLINSGHLIQDMIEKFDNVLISSILTNLDNLIQENTKKQDWFLANYGDILPSAVLKNLDQIFIFNKIKVFPKESVPRSMSSSFNRLPDINLLQYKSEIIPRPTDLDFRALDVSFEDIKKYYNAQIEYNHKSYNQNLNFVEDNIKNLEGLIESETNEILDKIVFKNKLTDQIVNLNEEIDLLSSPNLNKKCDQKIKILNYKYNDYTKKKENELNRYKLENKELKLKYDHLRYDLV